MNDGGQRVASVRVVSLRPRLGRGSNEGCIANHSTGQYYNVPALILKKYFVFSYSSSSEIIVHMPLTTGAQTEPKAPWPPQGSHKAKLQFAISPIQRGV